MLFIGLFVLAELLLIRRSFYGFNTADEMYFIGTSERIFRGERILIDEWNPTQQLCSFLLHPIYCMMREGLGSTEGIVMASRFLYLAFEGLLTVFLYLRLQRRGFASFGPVFLFLLFAPFGICAMSYNSIEFGLLTVLLAVLSAKMEHSVPEYLLCGILMAMIVLANPFALAMYVGYGALCLFITLRSKRRGQEAEGVLRFKNFMLMTLGAGMILVLFVLFVFQRGSLPEMLANIPHIVGDSEHQNNGLWYKTMRYFHLCFKSYRFLFCGFGLIYLATWLDRRRAEHGMVYMLLASVAVAPSLVHYGFFFEHIPVNYQMLPLTFWCLEAYFLTKRKEKRIFYGWFLPAFIFTLIVQYATNTGIITISVAYSLCSCVGLLFPAGLFREWRENYGARKRSLVRGFGVLLGAVICLQFLGTFYLRMNYAWGDDKMDRLTRKMERGPLKGVYTTPETAQWYGEILGELDMLKLTREDELMVVGVAPWIYLYVEAGCGNYSTWQVHENSTYIHDYYALHPEKFPDVIYMAHWADIFLECELSKPFWDRGYEVVYEGEGTVMMSPEQAALRSFGF